MKVGADSIVKFIAISLLCGFLLTGMIMLFPYEYCMDGDARGFPFGVTAPSCALPVSWGPTIDLEPESKNGQMFYFDSLIADILTWAAAVAFARWVWRKARKSRLPVSIEPSAS